MEKNQIRQTAFISLTAVLFIASVGLLFSNQSYVKKNKELSSSLQKLQNNFNELEARNKELLAKIDENTAAGQNFEKQSQEMKDSLEAIKRENESIQYDLKKAKAEAEQATEEKTYLEDMLIRKTKEIEALSKGTALSQTSPAPQAPTPAVAEASNLNPGQISEQIRQKDAEIQRLSDQNKLLSEKIERLYKITNDKISEINVAKIALEDTVSAARKKIDEEWNTVNLGSISVDKNGSSSSATPARTGPKKEGHILATNDDHGFVVVDLGKIDNLDSGAELSVLREGKPVAELTVLEVRDVMTACNIKRLEEGQKIQVNDLVLLKK